MADARTDAFKKFFNDFCDLNKDKSVTAEEVKAAAEKHLGKIEVAKVFIDKLEGCESWNESTFVEMMETNFAAKYDLAMKMFEKYDSNNDGKISYREINKQMSAAKNSGNADDKVPEWVRFLCDEDLNGDGSFDKHEILVKMIIADISSC